MPETRIEKLTVYTIGHSNRTIEAFLRLLQAHEIEQLVDVRTVPKSRANPQFGQEELPPVLEAEGIRYLHLPSLGGFRRPRPDSRNTRWRNLGFRGYADYMETPEFEANLEALIALAREGRTAIMCAEAVPYRCHRLLLSDALTARGIEVRHISSQRTATPHRLSPWARVEGRRVTYPGEEQEQAAA